MLKFVILSDKDALEIRSALLVHINQLSKFAHSKSSSSEASSNSLDRIDISESIINKLNRLFFK